MSLSDNALAAIAKGKTAQFVADAYGLSRREVVREAQAAGYRHDPTSDSFQATAASTRATPPPHATTPAATPREPDLLEVARALAPHSKRVARALSRAEFALTNLSAAVTDESAKAELRAKEQRLADELAAVRAELRGAPAKTGVLPTGPSAKQIREWAAGQGIACPPRGSLPRSVVEAYTQAHAA